jgi:hypothetical protein
MSDDIKANLLGLELKRAPIPTPYETRPLSDDVMVKFGMDNLYPNFLLNLYLKCPIHHAIIDTKASYIIGDGLRLKSGGEFTKKLNVIESNSEFIDKIVKDYLIHNAFAVEVQYNELTYDKEALSFNYVPTHSLRMNKDKTKFWYSNNWKLNTAKTTYNRWSIHNSDATSKLFWSDGSMNSENAVYVLPDYIACVESILTDMDIKTFNRNNITSNFSPSKLITYYIGDNVPKAIQDEIKRNLDSYFSGAGEKYMLIFANPGQEKMKVDNIDANTWDQAYQVTSASVEDSIITGHQISPSLFKETPGKLGNSNSIEFIYEMFKANYVQNKRNQLESALSQLFGVEVEFIDRPLFVGKIPDATKEKVYTINELRAVDNLPPLPDGDKLLTITSNNTQQVAQSHQFAKQEFRLTGEDFEKVKDMGFPKANFEFLSFGDEEMSKQLALKFDRESDISDYVLGNDIRGLSIKELKILIRKDLGIDITTSDLKSTLNDLKKAGVIDIEETDGKIRIKPPVDPKIPESRAVKAMYEYNVKPGLGAPLIPTSRDFCVKLIENDRYYTRQEIQTMSSIFGYDIYSYTGGYYFNAETQETTPSCRHKWTAVIVSPRNNDGE